MSKVRAFAPATITNLGPGFDVIGVALEGPGDEVEVELTSEFKGVKLVEIVNDPQPGLPRGNANVVEVVGQKLYESTPAEQRGDVGVKVTLYKNMKIGTGMGSSASSGAAVIAAMLELFNNPFPRNSKEVLSAAVYGEQIAAGSPHPDNVLPSLLGGSMIIYDGGNLDYIRFEGQDKIYFVVASPDFQLLTKEMRGILPNTRELVRITGKILKERAMVQEQSLELGYYDIDQIIQGISGETVRRYLTGSLQTPLRAAFIKGYDSVRKVALEAGAYGFSVSGSGASVFGVAPNKDSAHLVGEAVRKEWEQQNVKAEIYVSPINNEGARIIH